MEHFSESEDNVFNNLEFVMQMTDEENEILEQKLLKLIDIWKKFY